MDNIVDVLIEALSNKNELKLKERWIQKTIL